VPEPAFAGCGAAGFGIAPLLAVARKRSCWQLSTSTSAAFEPASDSCVTCLPLACSSAMPSALAKPSRKSFFSLAMTRPLASPFSKPRKPPFHMP
jgi:hypothetical protein